MRKSGQKLPARMKYIWTCLATCSQVAAISAYLLEVIHDHDPPVGSIFNLNCRSCGTVSCYADDSSFSISCPNDEDLSECLSRKYELISEFMCGNGLKLNGDKTHIMYFSTDRTRSTNVQ